MSDRDGKIWLSYNGEIYNYRKLRAQLVEQGQIFRSRTDSEVVLLGYKAWGIDRLVERLEGMFAFALYDSRSRRSFLVRDRFGVKPLFYQDDDYRIAFASELSALGAGVPGLEFERLALSQFLALGSVPTPRTALEGCASLPAGCYLELGDSATHLVEWAAREHVDTIPGSSISEEPEPHGLRGRLQAAVDSQLVADVPVGVFLSGGLDSSTLVALSSLSLDEPVTTVSVGFAEADFDETEYALAVAERFQTRHHRLELDAQAFWDEVPRILDAMSQPTVDGMNTYFVSRAAREAGLTVALSGIGADELFLGYPHFRRLQRWQALLGFRDGLPTAMRTLGASAAARLAGWRRGAASRLSYLSEPGPAAAYALVRGLYSIPEIERLIGRRVDPEPIFSALSLPTQVSTSLVSSVAAMEYRHYLQNQLLPDADQMSMAHSLEVRVPYLDRSLVEWVSGWSVERRMAGEVNKQLLVDALHDLLPREVWDRPKRGFTFPFDRWIRQERSELVQATKRSGLFDSAEVDKIWRRFMGGRNHWSRPWALFVISEYALRLRNRSGEPGVDGMESFSPLSA